MNLKTMSDEMLLTKTKQIAHQEREILTTMLHHLRENERRRLFSKLKYPSLFEYAIQELKYSESQAIRRISAMRLMRDIPELEIKIESGELSLTNLNLAQSLFSKVKKEGRPMNVTQKTEVLARLENQTTRGAEKIVIEISPSMKKSKVLDYNMIEDEGLKAKLLLLRGKFAHSNPNISLEELMHKLCDQALEAKSPSAPKVNRSADSKSDQVLPSQAAIRRAVWTRDQGKCTRCQSAYALEIDHIVPRARGGGSELANLRLLCRSCNQRAAIEHFGIRKMQTHLEFSKVRSCERRL